MTSKDKFGFPGFHPRKAGGVVYEMSDNPCANDDMFEANKDTSCSNGVITLKPSGPSNWHVGKNVKGFKDETGGCGKHFQDWEGKGYAWKPDDIRDIELKAVFVFNLGSNGFSISACTGHHTGSKCCQGHAYMVTLEPSQGNAKFRKEQWHVHYVDSPGTHNKPIDLPGFGSNKRVGIGFCRYNDPADPKKNVIVELWYNSDPDNHPDDGWKMMRREVDKPGYGWGDAGDVCGGAKDQVITWSGPKNRFKTNATSGTVKTEKLSMIEIDPGGSDTGGGGGGEPPPPPTTGTISRDWNIKYNIIAFGDDSCGVGVNATTITPFYNVTDNGSASNLHRDRTRACMLANSSVSLFIGKKPRRVKVWLSSTGSPPTGDVNVVLHKGNDDTEAIRFQYTGGPQLDAASVPSTKTQYTFENLTSNYVWQNGDRLCVEYGGNTADTTNEINVLRNTSNPYDGQASCAIKFDVNNPPDAYSAPDTGRDYAWEISEITTVEST